MTKVWNPDVEQPVLTRYNRNGIPYQINPERYIPSNGERTRTGSRGYSISSHENQQSEQEPEESNKQNHRRRIQVACGRCRKRKIRCSGPQGDNGCQNCKISGSDNCQFNRVQSQELPFKEGYNYDSYAAARSLQLRSGHVPAFYAPNYGAAPAMIPLASGLPYRQIPLNDPYQFPLKPVCYGPSYGLDYADENVEYNIVPHPYQQLNQDNVNLPYAPLPTSRSWTPAPGPKTTGNTMYYDTDPGTGYNQAPLPYQSSSIFPLRSSISSESNNFSFSGMASSLPVPSPLTSNERVLPMPARPLPRSTDGLSFTNGLTQNTAATVKAMHSAAPLPPSQSVYLPLSASSDGSSHSYSPTVTSSQQELYGTSSDDWANSSPDSQIQLRTQHSQPELYGYGLSSSNGNECTSGRRLQQDAGNGNGAGALSNGQLYVPYEGTAQHMNRSMGLDVASQNHAGTVHRGSVGGVRA